jgi:hypothetical protein
LIESIHLYLNSTKASARLRKAPWAKPRVTSLGDWSWDATDPRSLQMPLDVVLVRRKPLTVYLGTSLLKLSSMPLPQGLRSDEERNKVASVLLRERFGLKTADWIARATPLQRGKTTVVALGISKLLHARLSAMADEHRMKLASVRPFAFEALNALHRQSPTVPPSAGGDDASRASLAIVEEDALTMLVASASGYELTSGLSMRHGSSDADDELRRLRVGHGLREEDCMRLTMEDVPEQTGDTASIALHPFGSLLRSDFLDRLVRFS